MHLTTSVRQSPSWESSRSSDNQEIPRILWKPNVQNRFRKRWLLVCYNKRNPLEMQDLSLYCCTIYWVLLGAPSADIPRRTQQLLYETSGASQFCACRNSVHVQYTIMCIHTRESSWNPNSSTTARHRPQHDRPAACVIALQYSSDTLTSLHFHSRTYDLCARLSETIPFQTVYCFWNCVSVTARKCEVS